MVSLVASSSQRPMVRGRDAGAVSNWPKASSGALEVSRTMTKVTSSAMASAPRARPVSRRNAFQREERSMAGTLLI